MTPYEFLQEETGNVRRALAETLRYDYGPQQGREYYNECADRLNEIERTVGRLDPADLDAIAGLLRELQQISSWILLIERSHLGEFSWPFSEELKRIALVLLRTRDLDGNLTEPLIHVIAEGEGYQIAYEGPGISVKRPFVVIAFQRSLKHHALLHAIFGHELGHTALKASDLGSDLATKVITPIASEGPLSTTRRASNWLKLPSKPMALRRELEEFEKANRRKFVLSEANLVNWVIELVCDLFGVVLFGPAFVAAHKTILAPRAPNPYEIHCFDSSHPPYAVRHKLLVKAIRLLGWDRPILADEGSAYARGEAAMIEYIMADKFDQWADIVSDRQLSAALAGLREVMGPISDSIYTRLPAGTLRGLMSNLAEAVPPTYAEVGVDGKVVLREVGMSQTLYAGWAYWLGREHCASTEALSFIDVNRLCDRALLQQIAIKLTLGVVTL